MDANPELFQVRMVFNKDGKGTIFYLDPEYNILYRGEGYIELRKDQNKINLFHGYRVWTHLNGDIGYD